MKTQITKKEKKIFKNIIKKYSLTKSNKYQLSPNSFSDEDIIEALKVLVTKKITMSNKTMEFERKFANYIGSRYALMLNSGSSANLLAMFAMINPQKKDKLKSGDECLVPALCWSTSLWPIVQAGLKPVFVDIDPETLNISLNDLKKKITKKTKVLMLVHVLGNSTNMSELLKILNRNKILLIEDSCESLGSKYKNRYLGNYGEFGTFSFYYSHQITSGEGGMITCNNYQNYKILHSLRAHGWDRGFTKDQQSFNFINSGFNLRPTDIAAAIGHNQLRRIKIFQKNRQYNRDKIIYTLKKSKQWKNQFTFIDPIKNLKPSWFGLPILINKNYLKKKIKFLKFLNKNGIETRPIISGNFLNQPSIKLYKLNFQNNKFKGAQEVEDRGFFLGIHVSKISDKQIKHLVDKLIYIDNL